MNLNIITPDKIIYSGEASLVQLPGIDGLFEVLKQHAPMIAALGKGKVKVENSGKTEFFEIKGGIVEVLQDKILVLAE
jgi:ATP synthase, F1 epsilon subunit (delta in mitochondria)